MQDEPITSPSPAPESRPETDNPEQSLNEAWQSVAEFMDELKAENGS